MTVPELRHHRRGGCGLCGHPRALHSNGTTPCRAFACTAGPDSAPCPGFMTLTEAAAYVADGQLPERIPQPEVLAS